MADIPRVWSYLPGGDERCSAISGEENWRWIALEDQDPQTRRVKIAPLDSKLAIVPTEVVDGHMVEGTGMIVPVREG